MPPALTDEKVWRKARPGHADLQAYERKFLPEKGSKTTGETRHPSAVELRLGGFGKPNKEHTATQEACAETTIFFLLKSNYLDSVSETCLRATNLLVEHLASTILLLCDYGFGWLCAPDKNWATRR